MVPGLAPTEASERLSIFQAKFDDLWRKYITYSSTFQLLSFDLDNLSLLYDKIRFASLHSSFVIFGIGDFFSQVVNNSLV